MILRRRPRLRRQWWSWSRGTSYIIVARSIRLRRMGSKWRTNCGSASPTGCDPVNLRPLRFLPRQFLRHHVEIVKELSAELDGIIGVLRIDIDKPWVCVRSISSDTPDRMSKINELVYQ